MPAANPRASSLDVDSHSVRFGKRKAKKVDLVQGVLGTVHTEDPLIELPLAIDSSQDRY
jgi:hypothetical protein